MIIFLDFYNLIIFVTKNIQNDFVSQIWTQILKHNNFLYHVRK